MNARVVLTLALAMLLAAPAAMALNPDDELWIPAAVRGAGMSDSNWMTDLYIMNLGEEAVTVDIAWLERFADNSEAEGESFEIEAGATLVLADVIFATFGEEEGEGAIHIEIEEDEGKTTEDGEDEDDVMIVANARIYSVDEDGETVGQGFGGLISDAAIEAEDDEEDAEPTHVVGVTDNAAFRSNWYGLNITMDDETDEAEEAEVMVEVLDADGFVLASATFELLPLEPVLYAVADLGAGDIDNATLRFTMVEGAGLFGVSKVDDASNDPTTLEAHWECEGDEDDDEQDFTDEFFIDDCTFSATGSNPFFPLDVGLQLLLEGEEDGEVVANRITVLDETYEVDGVECRVVEEYETVDDELEEISRNYFAECVETGSVFYFGEHVDIYEDGEVVSHDGEWLAGENDAEPGIIMPGTILVGSRYMQEIAPEVAEDRAEHLEMGLTVETEVGTFEDCISVQDSSALDPDEEGDLKVYCPGVGNVIDEDLELVEWIQP